MSKQTFDKRTEELKRKFDTPWTPHPDTVRSYIATEVEKAYRAGYEDHKLAVGHRKVSEDRTECEVAIQGGVTHVVTLTVLYLKQEGYLL